ncbi:hypothetical protein EMPS_11110 [Entomortierella parvispora]|uniref:UBA domain-containing protein n=1 Tax=Entomortierella parvispora TaxID=205924 RepID=A0A9P3HLB3_9FUNG|nr:hypothetical protein EMPS_11110 [Entomortierella parvispora]
MAQHHASPYHDVKNVQMIASPLFKVPVPISPPYDMHALPSDILQRRYHEFTLEHRIVQEYQRIMTEEASVLEAKENAYKLYAEERQARLKQERLNRARKIAPGFLDNDDRRILTPTLVAATTVSSSSLPKDYGHEFSDIKNKNHFDYSEFEGGDSPVVESAHVQTKDEKTSQPLEQDQQQPQQQSPGSSPHDDNGNAGQGSDDAEEEVIVQAVPLSELTGMLRESCLEEDSSSNPAPRPWTERDVASEKSSQPSFATTRLDYREFEQGLGPPDPWDTPVDDLAALKDVITQQMGHSVNAGPQYDALGGRGGAHSNPQQEQQQSIQQQPSQQLQQHQQQQQHLHQPQQSLQQQQYPYQQTQPQQLQQMPTSSAEPLHSSFSYGGENNTHPVRSGQYNSSPIPVAAYTPTPKLTGLALQHQVLQQHQQQHQLQQQQQQQQRHSTGGISGMTSAQQQARFGSASPSPPPLPPPPRGMNASPSSGTAQTVSGPISRPPVPARPNRAGDTTSSDLPANASTGVAGDHVVTLDRSMTPPRPPLPPPPPTSMMQGGATPGSGANGSPALRPALRPRPPKDHDVFTGLTTPSKTPALPGSFPEDNSSVDQQQQVVSAPPHAETLINQLLNMGFTREQSRGALEKYDYDLEKATNHLLDWDD